VQITAAEEAEMTRRAALMVAVVVLGWPAVTAAQDKALVERGMKVYVEQKCSVCHSIDGKGNAKGPLDSVGLKLSADEIREWMVHPAEMTKKTNAVRKPPMRAYPNMPKQDIDAIVAYMLSLKKK
jgi:mono/diheme cytochrome c family protein